MENGGGADIWEPVPSQIQYPNDYHNKDENHQPKIPFGTETMN